MLCWKITITQANLHVLREVVLHNNFTAEPEKEAVNHDLCLDWTFDTIAHVDVENENAILVVFLILLMQETPNLDM